MIEDTEKPDLILNRINKATADFYEMLPHLRPGDVEMWAGSFAYLIKDSQMCPELLNESQKLACLNVAVKRLEADTDLLKETVDMTRTFGLTGEDLAAALQANFEEMKFSIRTEIIHYIEILKVHIAEE